MRTLLDLVDNSAADSLFHFRRFARCCSNLCDAHALRGALRNDPAGKF